MTEEEFYRDAGEDNLVTTPFGAPLKPQASVTEEGDGPVAKKLVAAIRQRVRGTVVNLQDVFDGRAAAAEKQKTGVSTEELARLHPAHAAYVFVQHQVAVISEQITALHVMAPLVEMVSEAEDRYHR